ncbi:hypothetical protein PSYMP_28968, partial [Pseudomonas amygdali pv. morsprunorum str. M302280]
MENSFLRFLKMSLCFKEIIHLALMRPTLDRILYFSLFKIMQILKSTYYP